MPIKESLAERSREDLRLFTKFKDDGDEGAREQLILRQADGVEQVARKHSAWRNSCSMDDLRQAGWIGVMRAVEKFETSFGVPFNYYAKRWSGAAMTGLIYHSGRTIRTPINVARGISKVKKIMMTLKDELGREPTSEEIGAVLGVTGKRIQKLIAGDVSTFSMFAGRVEGESADLSASIEGRDDNPAEIVQRREDIARMLETMDGVLSDNEKTAVTMRFGLGGKIPAKLDDIGAAIGMTKPGARYVVLRALKKIRDALECD